ncbi:endoplasmic reticulum Oxidoreductin 1-domain-containing protein [Dissophora ornata]|nr:hypothetical protein BGZ58_007378 [Dissophora ornata]KAI8600144.1 endoplasmic reticulum Oxidoreductin 1-domain-containing protein [Dissophora ornata]
MGLMRNVCGPILVALIAMLVAGMLYGNTSNSADSWSDPQPDAVSTSQKSQQQQAQCSNPSGLIGDSSCCDYETVGKLNVDFSTKLHEIVNIPFFRYFKVNLYKECPFWDNAGLCMNEDCSVETMDKSKVPEQWKANHLAKVSMSSNPIFGTLPPRPLIKEQDFCIPDTDVDEVYVDLRANPERFTGYSGPSAAMVWKAIYEENCFDVSKEMTAGCEYCELERAKLKDLREHPESHDLSKEENILLPPEPAPMKSSKPSKVEMDEIFSRVPKDKNELQKLVQEIARSGEEEESCLEKRVYYRLISGLHASISIHICDEWFNQTTGEWGPNLDCFVSRVGMHPERLENIYFDYAVMLRAVSKISDFLAGYEFMTGDDSVDRNIMTSVTELVDLVKKCPPTFNEKLLFHASQGHQGRQLKNQFRDHFRNVTRIMDCVGCEKCRLWGKVQTQGLGTALKILFSYDDASLQGHKAGSVLSRPEIVALINTFNRLSESISAIERFGTMYRERLEKEQEPSSPFSATTTDNQKIIKAPSKEEDNNDALVYRVWLTSLRQGVSVAYIKVDTLLESRNITMHRTALRNLASWIP